MDYNHCMIRNFKCPETEKISQGYQSLKFPISIQKKALDKLLQIKSSEQISDLRVPPGNRLEKLKGERASQFSIRINDQWRICFEWENDEAIDVEIVDYHR